MVSNSGEPMEYFNASEKNWRITQCCQFHNPKLAKRYNFGTTTKTYALKEGGKQRVQGKALENCNKLLDALTTYFPTQPKNLRSFRISSELFPCYTLDFTKDWYAEIWEEISSILAKAGDMAKQHEIRLSVHPGQYTVLASNKSDVVANSIKDLEYHALYGSLMGLEAKDFVMNIHLQGLYGGKHEDGINRFAAGFQYLSDYAQQCLAVENEDKPNGYDIEHVVTLCAKIPTRATLDTHHYACHRMVGLEKVRIGPKAVNRRVRDVEHITVNNPLFLEAVNTWKGVRPLFHKSQSFSPDNIDYWMKPNAHSEMYWDEDLMANHVMMLEYADFDVEAKHKETAVQHFYSFIKDEEVYADQAIVVK